MELITPRAPTKYLCGGKTDLNLIPASARLITFFCNLDLLNRNNQDSRTISFMFLSRLGKLFRLLSKYQEPYFDNEWIIANGKCEVHGNFCNPQVFISM